MAQQQPETAAERSDSSASQTAVSPEAASGENRSSTPESLNDSPGSSESARNGTRFPSGDLLEEIVVTGTHIRGVQNKTTSLITIDREAIERSGYSTTQDLLRALPQNFSGGPEGATDDGVFGNGVSAGANFTSANGVNLRGLGTSSTLVLLNGHRLAPSAYGRTVDVSLIPLAAVERIEVLMNGSAALYGADAVGGVINIVLRSDYEGADTLLRYGSVTDGGRAEHTLAHTIGGRWSSGNAVASLQYQHHDALPASERSYTAALSSPNDLLPRSDTYGLSLNGRQNFTDALELYGHALLSRRETRRDTSDGFLGGEVFNSWSESSSGNATVGGIWSFAPGWSLDVSSSYSRQVGKLRQHRTSVAQGFEQTTIHSPFTETSADILLNGNLFETSAGPVRMALGGSYRRERFEQRGVRFDGSPDEERMSRNVRAAYAEIYAPLIGETNRLPLLQELDLSLAVRYDRYSDFGGTTNPRIGINWSPDTSLRIHAAYSRSFRAPNPGELSLTDFSFIFVTPYADPAGTGGSVPALLLFGSTPRLDPERARTLDLGLRIQPVGLPDLTISANYYRIRYTDRIILPPVSDTNALLQPSVYGSLITHLADDAAAAGYVDAAVAGGAVFLDFLGNGVSGIRHVLDGRQKNAAIVKQSGVDLSAAYTQRTQSGTIDFRMSATYVDKIDTAFAPGATPANLVSTFGQPVKWRGRSEVGFTSSGFSVNVAANYVHNYVNTAGVGQPRVPSWTTIDMTASITLDHYWRGGLLDGTTLSLTALNLFDRDPPFVVAPSAVLVNYDPANANPLGRLLGIEVRKRW